MKKQLNETEVKISPSIIELIHARIDDLERYSDVLIYKEVEKIKIPLELIPFLLLYICLNFDCMEQSYKKKRDLLLKSAKYCARKFSHTENTNDYFFKYCMKKCNLIMTHQTIPTGPQLADVKNVINLYDRTFYQTGKVGQNNDLSEEEELFSEDNDVLHKEQKMTTSNIPQLDGNDDLSEDSLSEEGDISSYLMKTEVSNEEHDVIPSNISQMDGNDDFSDEEIK